MSSTLLKTLDSCSQSIGKYSALREGLFRELTRLPKAWKVQYKRDPAEGDATLPPKAVHETAIVSELDGLPFEGVATVSTPETYAPFKDFFLLDLDGNPAVQGTPEFLLQMRITFLLSQLLEAVRQLTKELYEVERQAQQRLLQVDLTPITKLIIDLPVFPYWPRLKDMREDDWRSIISAEKPSLDDALVTLRKIGLEDAHRLGLRRLLSDLNAHGWKVALGLAIAAGFGIVVAVARWFVRR